MKNNEVVVSVCMITYNHERYISEAIDGVLMQKTNFPIELIIGEDCSTDSTRKIVLEYAEKYPDIIRPLLPESNLGMMKNFIKTMEAAKGKFIALCEGDDYWTDPNKLQKQVDFLEANEEYSLLFHKIKVLSESEKDYNIYEHLEEKEYSGYEIYDKWTIPTCSSVFRNYEECKRIPRQILFGDIFLFLCLLEKGKSFCQDFEGAVYRRHSESISVQTNTVISKKLFYQYRYMTKRFPKYKEISKREMRGHLNGLIYAPYFKGIWKFRFYKMLQEPKLFFSSFLIITLTSYTIKRKRHFVKY